MGQDTLPHLTCSGGAQAELFEKAHGLEAEVEKLRLEEGGRKKEAEEYQTHLEVELAESQVLSPTELSCKPPPSRPPCCLPWCWALKTLSCLVDANRRGFGCQRWRETNPVIVGVELSGVDTHGDREVPRVAVARHVMLTSKDGGAGAAGGAAGGGLRPRGHERGACV